MNYMNTVVRKIYGCPELCFGDYQLVSEEELNIMKQMNRNSSSGQSCFPFVRQTEQGETYFDIYFWNEMIEGDFRRFVIRKGYRMQEQDEESFCDFSSRQEIEVSMEHLQKVVSACQEFFPDIHLVIYEELLHTISHLYFALHRSGPMELLYKVNLDYLAEVLRNTDEYNLLATTPSAMFDDIPIRMLRILNDPWWAQYLTDRNIRKQIKKQYK